MKLICTLALAVLVLSIGLFSRNVAHADAPVMTYGSHAIHQISCDSEQLDCYADNNGVLHIRIIPANTATFTKENQ